MFQNAVIGHEVFDGLAVYIIGVQLFVKRVEAKRYGGRLTEQALDKANSAPLRLVNILFVHERGGNSANEHAVSLTAHQVKHKVNAARCPLPLEREESRHIDPVPGRIIGRRVLTLDEANIILLAVRPMILGNFHQTKRWILVSIPRFDEKDVLVGHAVFRLTFRDTLHSVVPPIYLIVIAAAHSRRPARQLCHGLGLAIIRGKIQLDLLAHLIHK